MENAQTNLKRIGGTRRVADTPEDQVLLGCDGPLHLVWFALGHAVALVYGSVRALGVLPSPEQMLTCAMLGVGVFALSLLIRRKQQVAQSMAEIVAPLLASTASLLRCGLRANGSHEPIAGVAPARSHLSERGDTTWRLRRPSESPIQIETQNRRRWMTTFITARASLFGLAATGVMAVVWTAPVWAQAKTHTVEADCAAIQGAVKRPECMGLLGWQRHGGSWFSQDFTIRIAPPDQRGFGLEDAGGGVQSPVVPNNGARAPLRGDGGSSIGALRW